MSRSRATGGIFGVVAVVLLALPAVAPAATYRVTQTVDRAGACDARCALREAIIAANDRFGEDTIRLPRGRYELTIGGIAEDSAATGDLDVRAAGEKLTVIGAGAKRTIIDANRIDRVFNVIGFPDTRFAMRGVTITGGRGQMSYEGAGLELEGGGTTTTLARTRVVGNTTDADTSYDGAGIELGSGSALTIKRGVLKRNSTPTGDGGAIDSRGDLTLIKTTIAGNRAGNDGAGISHGGTSLTIRDSTISGNRAGTDPTSGDSDGAGLYYTGGVGSIRNSTISGNVGPHSSGDGAAIYAAGASTIDILNTTIAFNEAGDSGGGIYVVGGSAVGLTNTIVARNSALGGFGTNCAGTAPVSGGHNLENGSSCALSGPGDLNAGPGLRELADNGGATRTHALRRTSAAVNRGDNAACPPRDQRGVRRPQGRRCDIGSFELKRQRRR